MNNDRDPVVLDEIKHDLQQNYSTQSIEIDPDAQYEEKRDKELADDRKAVCGIMAELGQRPINGIIKDIMKLIDNARKFG